MLPANQHKIRILFVHHFSGMGGATMSLFYIIEKLSSEIFDVEVLFLGGEGEGVDYYRKHGIKVRLLSGIPIYPHAENSKLSFISRNPLKPFSLFLDIKASVHKLIPFFKEQRYDIVHLNTSLLLAVGKAAKLSGCKVVWHIREPLFRGIFGIRKYIVQRWINKYADQIFTISNVEAERLGKSDKVQVVYNYVDLSKFDSAKSGSAVRNEFSVSDRDFIVCNLGGTVHSKGADVFVKAAAILCQKYDDIKFILVGYSSSAKHRSFSMRFVEKLKIVMGLKHDLSYKVAGLIASNGLEEKVILTGLRTDIPDILAGSDALAWTATVPHFSRPIIEANAMGKPVVASDFLSTHEALKDQSNGLLCKPRDPADLAEKIEFLYKHRMEARKMGEEGLKLVRQKFNAEVNFNIIEERYFQLCNKSDIVQF